MYVPAEGIPMPIGLPRAVRPQWRWGKPSEAGRPAYLPILRCMVLVLIDHKPLWALP
jgi:hypothetical protein